MLPNYQKGHTIPGTPYAIEYKLGKGGMGTVYAVRDTFLNLKRAVKFIDIEGSPHSRERVIEEVLKEARVIAKLHQECPAHIVEVLSIGTTSDSRKIPFIIMEFIDGATLGQFMKNEGGKLKPDYMQQVGVEVLAALATAHEHGIVHRDMKPANIMCKTLPGTNDTRLKVIDWGITSEVNRRTNNIAGTFKFAAPEQINIRGEHPITGQTDIYSVGCILYEGLAGHGPFDPICSTNEQYLLAHLQQQPPLLSKVVPGCPEPVAMLIDSMLAKHPSQRPASARECAMKILSLSWEFSTNSSEDSNKTVRDFSTAVASALVAQEQKREQKGERVPQNVPATDPAHTPEFQTRAAPQGSTLRSPGEGPAAPGVVVVHDRFGPGPQSKTTKTSPERSRPKPTNGTVPLEEEEDRRAAQAPPAAPNGSRRKFFVNETAPLPPELDTREPSTFGAAVRAPSPFGQSRFVPHVLAVLAVGVVLLVALVVLRANHGESIPPATAAIPAATAAIPQATEPLPIASVASVASAAPLPIASSAAPTGVTPSATAVAATTSRPATPQARPTTPPRATASAQQRKLPASGL